MDIQPSDDYQVIVEQAQAAQQAGETARAYEFYARASELNPNAPAGWRGRAATARSADDALVSTGYAVALEPDDAAQKQDLETRLSDRLASATSADASTLVHVAQLLARVGLTEQALQMLRRATALDATHEEGLLWLAATTGNPDEARNTLQQLISARPENEAARAGLEAVKQQYVEAPANPPLLLPGVPDGDPAADAIREAEAALSEGDRPGAYQLFVQATEISPRSEAAWLGRARAADDLDEALTSVEQALAINPDSVPARESRTVFRVRKLREGMRKTDDLSQMPFVPGINRVMNVDSTNADSQGLRLVLLVVVITVVILLIAFFLIRPF